MRVGCYVNPTFTDGVGRHTREMVAGLAARSGVQCQVFTSGRDLHHNPDLAHVLESLSVRRIPVSSVNLERAWKLVGWPAVGRFIGRPIDVVYSPGSTRLPGSRTPTVITVHDVQAFEPDLPWSHTAEHKLFRAKWNRWLPKAIRESARVVTVSEFSKQRLCELLDVAPAKVGVVGNGVSEVFFEAGRCQPQGRSANVAVIGGLRTKKGADAILAVAAALRSRRSPVALHVVGINEPLWEKMARQHPNVVIRGRLSDIETAGMLVQSCGLLCLSAYEGFGLPVVEAMATGTVPVVANVAALPEIIGSGGMVVSPHATAEIADTLDRLAQDSLHRNEASCRALARAHLYTWDACVARLIKQLQLGISDSGEADCCHAGQKKITTDDLRE